MEELSSDYGSMEDYRLRNPIYVVPETLPDGLVQVLSVTTHRQIVPMEEMAKWPNIRFIIIDGQHRHKSGLHWMHESAERRLIVDQHPNLAGWPAFILDPGECLCTVIGNG